MTPETKCKEALKRALKAAGIRSYPLSAGGYSVAGLPDRMAVIAGQAVFFEVKSETGRLTALQVRMRDDLMADGAEHYVVRPSNIDEVVKDVLNLRERRVHRS